MRYQGSKNKLSKYIVPILQSIIDENKLNYYIEPFVGSASIIEKIKCENKIGSDINPELISLLKYMRDDPLLSIAPEDCSFEHYKDVRENRKNITNKYSQEYTSLIGYAASYGGRYFDGGYGRHKAGSSNSRNVYKETVKNMREHAPFLSGINFECVDYTCYNTTNYKNCLFYCDSPYINTKKYPYQNFNQEQYYEWLRELSKNNFVIISEYTMPDDFECIWSKEVSVLQKSDRVVGDKAIEKLWRLKRKSF